MLIALLSILPCLSAFPANSVALQGATVSNTDAFDTLRPEKEHARPKLIAEKTTATPGSTVWIAVTFEMDEGWHIYWDGQNDSGMPVSAIWTLPEHVKVGQLVWPTPKRAVNATIEAIDYVYEKQVTALAELTIDDSAMAGQPIKLAASLKWLVCHDQCKAGKKDVSLDIQIVKPGAASQDSKDAGLFVEARKSIPKPAKEAEPVISSHWHGDTLQLTVRDASGVVFYPDAKCAPMSDAIGQGESKTGELKMEFKAKSGMIGAVSGIVEVRRADSKPIEYYTIAIPGKERKE